MDAEHQLIFDEYLQSLTLPKVPWTGTQFVIAPFGNVGSGKTTVLKALSERLGLVRTCGDDIRVLLKKRGLPLDFVRELHTKVVTDCIAKGYSVAIDSDSVSEEARKALAELTSQGVTVIYIRVTAPEHVILDRLTHTRSEHPLSTDPEVWKSDYFRRKPLHENLTLPFTCTIDSSLELEPQLTGAERAIRTTLGA